MTEGTTPGPQHELRPRQTPRSRRDTLKLAAMAAGASVVGAAVAAGPAQAQEAAHGSGRKPAFVVVPGSHGNAAVMTPLISALTRRGRTAVAVDLPGHGPEADYPLWYSTPQDLNALQNEVSSISNVRLADNVERVISDIEAVGHGAPVVLVGHSLGGATTTAVVNKVPHLIHRVVFIAGFCCSRLKSVYECVTSPEYATSKLKLVPPSADGAVVKANRFNWRTAEPKVLAALKEAYLQDGTDAEVRAALAGLQPDETIWVSFEDCSIRPEAWRRVPRTYIRLVRDQSMPIPLQNRMIADADATVPGRPFQVIDLDATHLGIIVSPQETAAVLDGLG
ncbi:alpha/beta hydrolase [Streptomyces sp. NPDC050516]|uniref:alpha/beta hydrolase n=1 Tax=Streptomyces sp. NPDC050516 TaxID=3365621 RepID=UPI0037A6571E